MSVFTNELCRLINEDGKTPEDATLLAIKWARTQNMDPWTILLPFVRNYAKTYERSINRHGEHEAFRPKREKSSEDEDSTNDSWTRTPPPVRMRPLLKDIAFKIREEGIVKSVTWGDATADQHEMRALAQHALGNKCIRDANRHDQATVLIRATDGVKCLNDLPAQEWEHLVDEDIEG